MKIVIVSGHWKIDNLLHGSDQEYEDEYTEQEGVHESIKRQLNLKLNETAHQHQAIPRVEIPIFNGNYAQWPAFMDLYCESIHNNNLISKAQKMQHLKGKLRGEAERLVQHLTVSAENYDTCWTLLTHRYNNIQLLFTKHMQVFLNQPAIQQQATYELKKLHDTSLETIYAIRNLGIDTTSWSPILIHILTSKLDPDTYASYMETRKAPRELPDWNEFVTFLEGKFTALETVGKKKQQTVPSKPASIPPGKPKFGRYNPKIAYHAKARHNFICPVCKEKHLIIYCNVFMKMSAAAKLKALAQLNVCDNCLYSHNGSQCLSARRCKVCGAKHHTAFHDLYETGSSEKLPAASSSRAGHSAPCVSTAGEGSSGNKVTTHVAGDFNEILLATLQLKVKAADGTLVTLRCLLDQGSQVNLITESAVQRLGLKKSRQSATVSGIGSSSSQSKGTVGIECVSLDGAYKFRTEAIVMTKMLNNLPNCTFEKQRLPYLEGVALADPDYNVSSTIDLLLDAGIYADIIMEGILRGPPQAPIAQQTKLGWVLMGNITSVRSFNCHVVLNDIEEITRFWESEEICGPTEENSAQDEYCEKFFKETTRRLADGRYEVRIPMKKNFEQNLGASRPQSIAQFLQLERRLGRDEVLAESYKQFMAEYITLGHMAECVQPQEPSCHLPHHGVIRLESTTTKLRTVFNASSPTKSGFSLNQLMERGPNLQQDIQAMILRWRMYRYVYTADIEKFYRQIRVQEQDQHLQKIVWRSKVTDPIKTFCLGTVTYGTRSAAYLAMRTIKQLIEDDGAQYPLAASLLDKQLYVDDLLGGSDSIEEAKVAQAQLITLLRGGGFNLRKWAANDLAILEDLAQDQVSQNMLDLHSIESNKTLGMVWNPITDQFTFKAVDMTTRVLRQEAAEALHQYATPEVKAILANEDVEWHFNAPAWPSAGGLWERAVRSTKQHLRRVLGEQKLTYEEFSTLLAQIEACLNSRPLTPLTEDVGDLDYLTPGHFLVGGPMLSRPRCPGEESTTLRGRWQMTEKMQRSFWKRWSVEYLHTLQTRNKWNTVKEDLQVGDMALIKEDNLPPARWLLGRVTETHPGKDGHVRVVTLKTKAGYSKRPITKVARLPLDQHRVDHAEEVQKICDVPARGSKKTQGGRRGLASYLCSLLLLFAVCSPASAKPGVMVTSLDAARLVYFDKLGDMQVVQDE